MGQLEISVFVAIASDTRLSPDARAIVQHVYMLGDGAHELELTALAPVLTSEAGVKRARNAVQNAERYGWLHVVRGGTGRHPRYTVTPPAVAPGVTPGPAVADEGTAGMIPVVTQGGTAEDLPSPEAARQDPAVTQGGTAGPPHVRDQGDQKTTSSSSPSPSAGAQARELSTFGRRQVNLLKSLIGAEYETDVDLMLELCPTDPGTWASSVVTQYLGATPHSADVLRGVPPPDRPATVAKALNEFATSRQQYNVFLFRGFVEAAQQKPDQSRKRVDADNTAGKQRSRAHAGRAPAPLVGASEAPRRKRGFGA